jgi:hypothetical protein
MPVQASVSVRFDRPGPAGLEVDGQQGAAAIEEASLDQVPVGIVRACRAWDTPHAWRLDQTESWKRRARLT